MMKERRMLEAGYTEARLKGVALLLSDLHHHQNQARRLPLGGKYYWTKDSESVTKILREIFQLNN